MNDKISEFLINQRIALLITSILVTLLAGLGAGKLAMDMDYKVFFDDTYPELVAYEEIEHTYGGANNVLLVIDFGDSTFTNEHLTMVSEITEEAWTLPYSLRVDSIANFQYSKGEEDDLVVNNLYENPEQLSAEQLAEIQQLALNEPILKHRLISKEANVTAINIQYQLSEKEQTVIRDVMVRARELRDKYEGAYAGTKIHLIGQIPIDFAFSEVGEMDGKRLMPIMATLIIILLAVLLRSAAAVFTTLFLIGMAIAVMLGLVGHVGLNLNSVTVMSPIIVLVIAIADQVHLLNAYFAGMRRGLSKHEAMSSGLKLNLKALFITSITTAMGFLTLNFGDVPPLRQLGTIAAVGVMVTFIFCITVTPALMLLLSRQRGPKAESTHSALAGFAEFIINHRKGALLTSMLFAVALLAMLPMNELNDDNVEYFHPETTIRQAADFTQLHLGGLTTIEYSLNSNEAEGINDPDFLSKADQFVEWYRAQPEVLHIFAHTDTMKRLNKNMHGEDEAWYILPDSRELAAQYLLLYEMSLPFGLDLNNQISMDKSSLRFTASLLNMKAQQLIEFENRVQVWLDDNAPGLASVGSSPPLMFAHIGQKNIVSMIWGNLLALLVISVSLMFFFGSINHGLISFIPNLFPAAMAFGVWGFFVGEINLGAAAVFSITLGIVVDDTVHFMTKYLRARNDMAYSAENAVRYTFKEVGPALVTTTIVLSVGFFVLSFSYFDVNATIGKLVSGTILLALLFDFLFLPSFLLLLDGKKEENNEPVNNSELGIKHSENQNEVGSLGPTAS